MGTRKADIVGKGDDGVLVVENQFSKADWDHWGRLEAYARLREADVAFDCQIVGTGDQDGIIAQRIARHGLAQQVRLHSKGLGGLLQRQPPVFIERRDVVGDVVADELLALAGAGDGHRPVVGVGAGAALVEGPGHHQVRIGSDAVESARGVGAGAGDRSQRLDQRLAAWLLQNTAEDALETTHQMIADELGSTREVISRLLKEMEREGVLALSRGRIRLVDRTALGALVREEVPGQ